MQEWIERNATTKFWTSHEGAEPIDCYVSKVDGSFMCFVSGANDLKWMIRRGFEQVQSAHEGKNTASLAWVESEQKWYGWSHRAVFGFGIGSETKKGDCGYIPIDINDFIERSIAFWSDESHKNVSAIPATNEDGILGAQVTWEYVPELVPNKALHATIGETFAYPPEKYGRGEWMAETLEDAKQMAIDFARSVS